MSDRGYWARLGREGVDEDEQNDHPLGFHYGTIGNTIVPRLALLLQTLTNQAQLDAINALWTELRHYFRQTNGVIEDLREMARHLKDLEDVVAFECQDLEQLRESWRKYPRHHEHFDPETYKRSSYVSRDLAADRFRMDWDYEARLGRSLDGRRAAEEARREQEAAERRGVRGKERAAKEQAALLARLGVLYKTSPAKFDKSTPRNLRKDIPAAEKMLTAMGFEIQVEGDVRCCIKTCGDLIVYADPRGGNSLTFNVFNVFDSNLLKTFWIKDKTGNPLEKLEAQLELLRQKVPE